MTSPRNGVTKLIEVHAGGGWESTITESMSANTRQWRRIGFPASSRLQPGVHSASGTKERESQTSLIPLTRLDFHSLVPDVFVIICIPSDQWLNRSIHNK